MSRNTQSYTEQRRTFLKTMAVAGGATATVLLTGQAAGASPEQNLSPEAPENRGYHETPHIRNYYRIARL
ncbi:MAG: formate dehydrogenase [Gammaproteobacteria bacterium]|nr:formate dehydrogenase [Gammaproteobacteria bacterium]